MLKQWHKQSPLLGGGGAKTFALCQGGGGGGGQMFWTPGFPNSNLGQ